MDEEHQSGARWFRLEWVGAAALAITVLCVLVGQSAERYAATEAPAEIETAKVKPHFNSIDYASTASIKSGVVVIGPCDARKP